MEEKTNNENIEEKEDNKATQEVEVEDVQDEKEEKDELQTLKDELKEQKDKYLRLYAEFDNARKRNDREKAEFVKFANEGLLGDFLGIVDNLELSVQAAQQKHEDYEAFLKGVEMVMAQIRELLKKNDVKIIEAEGKKFDPNCHEVLMQEPKEDVDENTVLEVFQKGYKFGDRVLRTAKVKLSKK